MSGRLEIGVAASAKTPDPTTVWGTKGGMNWNGDDLQTKRENNVFFDDQELTLYCGGGDV